MIKTLARLICASLLVTSAASHAAQFSPVRLVVFPGQKTASLQIRNDSDTESNYDIRVKSWISMNDAGRDDLQDTDAVITSRPVVTIPPQQTVTIRLIVTQRSGQPTDNYRVVINDITPVTGGGSAVRISSHLPMFVSSDANAKGNLELQGDKLVNTGGRPVRITSYVNKDGKDVNTLRYILAGQSMTLPVRALKDVVTSDSLY